MVGVICEKLKNLKMKLSELKMDNIPIHEQEKFKVPYFWIDSQIGDKSESEKLGWVKKRIGGLLESDLENF